MTSDHCHLCASDQLREVNGLQRVGFVTSDCRPWPNRSRLCVCRSCGAVQKQIDQSWRDDMASLYGSYRIYLQSGGIEQPVFDDGGAATTRSDYLLEHLLGGMELPDRGRLLDLGCGNGAFLQAFSRRVQGWTLIASELDDTNAETILQIENVEALYTCELSSIPGTFDLASMIHVLEHIVNPLQMLKILAEKIPEGGCVLITLPNFLQNPFDLIVADHSTHFTSVVLRNLLVAAGFAPLPGINDVLPKEFAVVGRRCQEALSTQKLDPASSEASVLDSIAWLQRVVDQSHGLAGVTRQLGLFGTSIAGTWLASELDGKVSFFVDEDPNRIGRTHLGLPIFAPHDAPRDSDVIFALPPAMTQSLAQRFADGGHGFRCHWLV
jgi:SAM-dependent methyltransferase